MLALAIGAAGCRASGGAGPVTLRFWAMGREGEVVQELVHDFERENPSIHVVVQQIPWSAAHEKLLTSHVGGSTPDAAQLGNTWVPEFTALRAIEPLAAWIASSSLRDTAYFTGVWDTNVIEGIPYGIPWYVDTRVIFYRKDLLARAGYTTMPQTWSEWRRSMEKIKQQGGKDRYAIFLPTNEYTPWILFGLEAGSPFLRDHDTRGAFGDSAFRGAMRFAIDLFHHGLAPAVPGRMIPNVYQEFERGTFAMYITGPWQLGEFKNRLSPAMQNSWDTAPMPGPNGPGLSLAGGSSLVLFGRSPHKPEAWKLIEFLSRPEQQLRFYALTGDLPARRVAWNDTSLTNSPHLRAFQQQFERVASTPKVPEWEEIAVQLRDEAEAIVLGAISPDSALARLDRNVDRILEKRRWMQQRRARAASGSLGSLERAAETP